MHFKCKVSDTPLDRRTQELLALVHLSLRWKIAENINCSYQLLNSLWIAER